MKFILAAASLMLIAPHQVNGMVVSNRKMISSQDTSNVVSLLTTARVIHGNRSQQNDDNASNLISVGLFGRSNPPNDKWARVLFDDNDMIDEYEEEDMTNRVSLEMKKVVSPLQKATQSEVPDMELLLQMEAARHNSQSSASSSAAAAFIDFYDASMMERLAMSSIPSQLPQPVLREVSSSVKKIRVQKSSQTKLSSSETTKSNVVKTARDGVSSSTLKIPSPSFTNLETVDNARLLKKRTSRRGTVNSDRVSHEEELQLAHIIQRGVKLHNIKSEFELQHGRDITRTEWTELAELDSPKELRRLVSTYRKAKNKLVTANMGLVHAVVKDLYAGRTTRMNGVTKEELIQEGSLGLIRAAELFDPNRGLRFSTYAYIWIKGMLSNNKLDQTIALPAREQTKWNKIQKAIQELKSSSLEITVKQVSTLTEISVEEVNQVVNKMTKTRNLLSLDYQYESTSRSGSDTLQLGNALMQDKNLQSDVDLVERLQLRADVIAALARNLDQREARLMRLRYGLKDGKTRTIVECAEAMGISRARAHQLATGCLQKLREADDAESLQEYLLTIA